MPLISRQCRTNRQAHRLRAHALAGRLAGARFIDALDRLRDLVAKANFNPDQPRAPGGGPGAGQWIYVDGYAQGQEPGIGHNGGPPLDPPDVPKEPPADRKARLKAAKAIAKWLALNIARRAGPLGIAITAAEIGYWAYTEYPSIRSYGDVPKTMDELIRNAREPRPGYERHHIVEQTPAMNENFTSSMINGIDNIVSVPTYKHHEISAWYSKPNADYGGLSPRDYLRGKDWTTRVEVGRNALIRHGVLVR